MTYTIFNEDAVKWAKEYDGMPFHALLSDPPYHLTSIVKRFGKKDSAPAQYGTDGVFSRSSKGFMGQTWDGGDIAFQPETWEAFSRVLYPGAFGMAFSASRNWHRLAVAIEDAGFIIHPSIFGWLNGQGFPKATNIQKQLDDDQEMGETWKGHRYGLQALKPAVEPIIVFQKPYEGRPIDNIVNTGAGALNIDGSRIPLAVSDEYTINTFDDGAKPWGDGAGHKFTSRKVGPDASQLRTMNRSKKIEKDGWGMNDNLSDTPQVVQESGRWTANFILDEETAPLLDEQTGVSKSIQRKPTGNPVYPTDGNMRWNSNSVVDSTERGFQDEGGASRFFYTVSNQIDESDPIYYTAKVSPKERNAGLDDFPEQTLSRMNTHNGDPSLGEAWEPIDDRTGKPRNRFQSRVRNPHPTCKPIALAKYLATILLPPVEYAPRRIMVPFSGVASEMIGACLAGWEEVVGIEFDTENGYVDIANKRLEHWIK